MSGIVVVVVVVVVVFNVKNCTGHAMSMVYLLAILYRTLSKFILSVAHDRTCQHVPQCVRKCLPSNTSAPYKNDLLSIILKAASDQMKVKIKR